MISKFYILGSNVQRPQSKRTIFTDGAPDATYREGIDMELSHWIPNRTPEKFRADTSTEICMNFIEDNPVEKWDLAINNHLDVDGVLSVFTLLHPEFSLKHRSTIVQAAEMGDFSAWGEEEAQIVFQGLTDLMYQLKNEKVDIQKIYQQCFDRVFELIEKKVTDQSIQTGLKALHNSVNRIASGEIKRDVLHERFVHYQIPVSFSQADLHKALRIPHFNELIKDDLWLHPHARNYKDREKVQLVSVETVDGYYYDLWYPGYMWADTPNSWRAPGFRFNGSTNGYYYGYQPLQEACRLLQANESGSGRWTLAKNLSPFESIIGRNFPVVLSFIDDKNHPAVSKIPSNEAAAILSKAFN